MDSTDGPEASASSEFYLDEALEVLERARDLTDVETRPDLYGVILHDIADVYESTGRTAEAFDLYRDAAEAKRRSAEHSDLLITLLVLASRLMDRAEFEEARVVTDEAADLVARPGGRLSPSYRAGRAFSLGMLYDRLGDAGDPGAHHQALDAFHLSLSLYDEDVEPRACANTLREIGRLQALLGRVEDAVASLSDAVAHYRRDGDGESQAVVLIDMARMYQRLAEQSASRTVMPRPRDPADDDPGLPDADADVDADAELGQVDPVPR